MKSKIESKIVCSNFGTWIISRKKMKKILFVSTENSCNNFCIGCGIPPFQIRNRNGRPTQEVIQDMEEGKKAGYKIIHLTGGELTIQDNVFELLSYARKLFDKVYFTSNGRMLAYTPFVKKLVSLNLDCYSISLHGPTPEIHQAWTRTPGSFEQTVKGIQNLVKYTDKVCVNTVVWRENYNKLDQMANFILKLGVRKFNPLNLVPTGRAKKIYPVLMIDLLRLKDLDKQFIDKISFFSDIDIEDFPRCIFSNELFRHQDIVHIFDTSGCFYLDKKGNITTYGIFATRDAGFPVHSNLAVKKQLPEIIEHFQKYKYKIKLPVCQKCKHLKYCSGVLGEYIKVRGFDNVNKEVAYLRQIHNC